MRRAREGWLHGIVMRGGLLILLLVAAVSDFRTGKISNRLILTGLIMGLFYRIWIDGPRGIFTLFLYSLIPVLILFLLFLMRVLGAGDIKLFSIISGICGLQEGLSCIAAAFVAGAVVAVIRMLRLGNLRFRIFCFIVYIRSILSERCFYPYPYGAEEQENTICFSFAILLGYLINMGVCH